MVPFSAVKLTRGNEKNMSFVIPKSQEDLEKKMKSDGKKIEARRLVWVYVDRMMSKNWSSQRSMDIDL